MKTHFLFPNQFKKLGWIIFIPSFIMAIIFLVKPELLNDYLNTNIFAIYYEGSIFNNDNKGFFKIIENDLIDEFIVLGLIIGSILISFSKMETEDEMISKIRYESLVWSTYFSYSLLILFTLFFYGTGFYSILLYNTFTLLLFFLIRFHYLIYKLNKSNSDDE
jgi:hypothetical protein